MKKYRPSNGTEGEIFMGRFCARCSKDNAAKDLSCEIIVRTMDFDVDDPEYPEEWQYDTESKPTCTAFSHA